jgi:hypothetical protein
MSAKKIHSTLCDAPFYFASDNFKYTHELGYIPNCRWLVKTPAKAESSGRPNSRRDHRPQPEWGATILNTPTNYVDYL